MEKTTKSVRHTPGPWTATPVHGGVFEIDYNPGNNWKAVCTVSPNALGQAKVIPIEAEANARLIAAAPDLLAVCKAVEDWESSTVYRHADVRAEYGIPENMNVYDWVRAARRAAIAKATTADIPRMD